MNYLGHVIGVQLVRENTANLTVEIRREIEAFMGAVSLTVRS